MEKRTTSEEAFQKALDAENRGETAVAERWLKLAVKKEEEEKATA